MSEVLTVCFWVSVFCFALTAGLLVVPVTPRELRLWRNLRVRSLRRRITRRRSVNEPYHVELTVKIARRNLVWHLFLTGLFCSQIAWAVLSEGRWWRPFTIPLAIFCIGYFAGSLVQRQKIAIVRARRNRASHAQAT
jgi:hypothetical protein